MNFLQTLGSLKSAIDKELERQFDIAIKDAGKHDVLIAEALAHGKKIALSGGKRIRGALLMQAYFGVGGKERKKILQVAAAIELVHLFLLVHDDIIDCGSLRHGQKTLHRFFAQKNNKNFLNEKNNHFGESMGIITGDMIYSIANKLILEAGFSATQTANAFLKLQKIVGLTIIGQSQDIGIEYYGKASEQEVLAMYENKTARYTFEGPLHLGAMFAGCEDKKTFQSLSRYAVPLGIAFQIQDDILGVFGSEKKMGKSVASDIEEGKLSLLVVEAREKASKIQQKQLDEILGKKKLTTKEIKNFQEIITATGSLQYAQDLANKYFKQGKSEIEKIILLTPTKKFLLELVTYLEKREV